MNSNEWRMCSRCPYRQVDLMSQELSPTRTGLDVEGEKNGLGIRDIESCLFPKFVLDENAYTTSTSSSSLPLTEIKLQPIHNFTNLNLHYPSSSPSPSSAVYSTNFSSISPSSPIQPSTFCRKPNPAKLVTTIPLSPSTQTNCARFGCQSSHWSDDSSEEDAGESEAENDSPTKIKRIVGRMRKRVVRAFSGTEKEAVLDIMEKIAEVNGEDVGVLKEMKGTVGDLKVVEVAAAAATTDPFMASVTEDMKGDNIDVEVFETIEQDTKDDHGAVPKVLIEESTECIGCRVGVCPGSSPGGRSTKVDEGDQKKLPAKIQNGSCAF